MHTETIGLDGHNGRLQPFAPRVLRVEVVVHGKLFSKRPFHRGTRPPIPLRLPRLDTEKITIGYIKIDNQSRQIVLRQQGQRARHDGCHGMSLRVWRAMHGYRTVMTQIPTRLTMYLGHTAIRMLAQGKRSNGRPDAHQGAASPVGRHGWGTVRPAGRGHEGHQRGHGSSAAEAITYRSVGVGQTRDWECRT